MEKLNKSLIYFFILTLLFRITTIIVLPISPRQNDALEYHKIAVNISQGKGFSITPNVPTPARAPLYPFFLSIIYHITDSNSIRIVQISQCLLDALTTVLIFLCALMIFSPQIAYAAGIIYIIYPINAAYTSLALSETLFTFLFMLFTFFILKGLHTNKNKFFILAGSILGLSALTRPTTLPYPVFIAVLLVVFYFSRQILLKILLFIISAYIVILPWTIRNYYDFNTFLPIAAGGGYNVYITGYQLSHNVSWDEAVGSFTYKLKKLSIEPDFLINGHHPKITLQKSLLKEGKQAIKDNFRKYLFLLIKRFPRFWWTSHSSIFNIDKPISSYISQKKYVHISIRFFLLFIQGLLLIGCIIGITSYFTKIKNNFSLIILAGLLYFSLHILFDPCPRFHVPVLPYIIIFFAVAIVKIKDTMLKRYLHTVFDCGLTFYGNIVKFILKKRSVPPLIVQIDLTYRCNLKCAMCFQKDIRKTNEHDKELTLAQIKMIIDKIPSYSVITFTGGEIFVRHDIKEILSYALVKHKCNILTNASIISDDILKLLVNKNLLVTGISIDGLGEVHDNIRGCPGVFDKTASFIEKLQKYKKSVNSKKPMLDIKTVILKENIFQINEIAGFAQRMEADYFTLSFEYGSYNKWHDEDIDCLIDEIKKVKETLSTTILRSYPGNLFKSRYMKQFMKGEFKHNYFKPCLYPWFCMHIDPYGKVYPCRNFFSEPLSADNNFDFNIVWNGKNYRDFRKNLTDKKIFPECINTCCYFKLK